MATIGMGAYAQTAHEFFDGLRSYDLDRVMATLADDADLQSPWNQGTASGKDAVKAVLESVLSDAVARPSFTIKDIAGDGHLVHLTVSVSGRFGEAPKLWRLSLLHLKGKVHHIVFAAL